MKRFATGLASLVLLVGSAVALAQYPLKPIRLIVPFPPGGSNDIVARLIGQELTGRFGQQVIIDNRGGAGGMIGTETAAQFQARRLHAARDIRRLRVQPGDVQVDVEIRPGKVVRARRRFWSRGPNALQVHPATAGENGEGSRRAREVETGRAQLRVGGCGQLSALEQRNVQRARRV